MPILELERISFKYGEQWVLQDVTLTVAKGEFFGILGPNGSGKSTLLNLIDGIRSPLPGQGTGLNQKGNDCPAEKHPQDVHLEIQCREGCGKKDQVRRIPPNVHRKRAHDAQKQPHERTQDAMNRAVEIGGRTEALKMGCNSDHHQEGGQKDADRGNRSARYAVKEISHEGCRDDDRPRGNLSQDDAVPE